MQTTFILAGGEDSKHPEYAIALAETISTLREGRPKILSCFFSRDNTETIDACKQWDEWFSRYFPHAMLTYALEDRFEAQLREADILYLHGGSTENLINAIHQYDNFSRLIKGKVIIGSSAGANALSTYCISSLSTDLSVRKGLGIIDIPVAVHFRVKRFRDKEHSVKEWDAVLDKLSSITNGQNILCLPEGKFTILQQ